MGKKSSAFLFGARGVGKTRLAEEYLASLEVEGIRTHRYDLLKSEVYERYLKQPHLLRLELERALVSNDQIFAVIDEVQRVPALLDEVHSLIESHKGKIRFLLSGSSARKLKRHGANLLAGRALTLHLFPLTFAEANIPFEDCLRLGSLPGIILDNESPEMSLRSYVSTYLKEEIQQEAHVRRIDAFARFLEIAAQYHCEQINASEIARSAGVTSNTIGQYFDILEDTLLGWRLPGWSASTHKQLRTTPKFYFFDNGVANTLRGELNIQLKESSGRYGKLFEAWVVQELIRCNSYGSLDLKFSYWRTNSGAEVDLIVSRGAGKPLLAIEIKSSTAPEAHKMNGLHRFREDYPTTKLVCLCRTPRVFQRDGIDFLPWADGLTMLASL